MDAGAKHINVHIYLVSHCIYVFITMVQKQSWAQGWARHTIKCEDNLWLLLI